MADLILHHYIDSPFPQTVSTSPFVIRAGFAWSTLLIPNIIPKPDLDTADQQALTRRR